MIVEPVTLVGPSVILEPLSTSHLEELRSVSELEDFQYFVTLAPESLNPLEFERFIGELVVANSIQPFVIRLRSSGCAIGSTSFMNIQPDARSLEIGMTWIQHQHRRTAVNPEAKLLLLEHAFERLHAIRVQLKTDKRNIASQGAIVKLGAVYEGTLRQHGIQRNGTIRDTVMFSILDSEWPHVRAMLLERLDAFTATPTSNL